MDANNTIPPPGRSSTNCAANCFLCCWRTVGGLYSTFRNSGTHLSICCRCCRLFKTFSYRLSIHMPTIAPLPRSLIWLGMSCCTWLIEGRDAATCHHHRLIFAPDAALHHELPQNMLAVWKECGHIMRCLLSLLCELAYCRFCTLWAIADVIS